MKSVRAYVNLALRFFCVLSCFKRNEFDRDISICTPLFRRKEVDCRYVPHWKSQHASVSPSPVFVMITSEIESRSLFPPIYAIQCHSERYVLAKTRPLVTNICMSQNRHTDTGRQRSPTDNRSSVMNSGERARVPSTRVNSRLHFSKSTRHC